MTEQGFVRSQARRFLDRHPYCCFCGGAEPATTVEHQPSRIVFPGKHRPKGMEYPSCQRCNDQTRAAEALLSFMCRMGGSMRTGADTDLPTFKKTLKSVERSFPGLLARMNMGQRYIRSAGGVLQPSRAVNGNQSEIHISLCRVAAMGALAAFYERGKGAATEACRIVTSWTHIQNREIAPNVERLLNIMGEAALLRQGAWETSTTFFRKTHEAQNAIAFLSIYHETVALIAKLYARGGADIVPPEVAGMYTFRPDRSQGLVITDGVGARDRHLRPSLR